VNKLRLQTEITDEGDFKAWAAPVDPDKFIVAKSKNSKESSEFKLDRIECSGISPDIAAKIIAKQIPLETFFPTNYKGNFNVRSSNGFSAYGRTIEPNPLAANGETVTIREIANFRLEAAEQVQCSELQLAA
jgi:hypothetical protein